MVLLNVYPYVYPVRGTQWALEYLFSEDKELQSDDSSCDRYGQVGRGGTLIDVFWVGQLGCSEVLWMAG